MAWSDQKTLHTHRSLSEAFKKAFDEDPLSAMATLLDAVAAAGADYPRDSTLRRYVDAALADHRAFESKSEGKASHDE